MVGQEHITTPLARALDNDRVHHAYLSPAPAAQQNSTARIMARSLNCEQGPTSEPCGACQGADLAAGGRAPSTSLSWMLRVTEAWTTPAICVGAMFAPASSRYKIYIIDEAHMVSTAGFNALLRWSRSPDHVRFIFADRAGEGSHHYSIPDAQLRIRLVGNKDLQQHLASICEAEGVGRTGSLALVARAGAGRAGLIVDPRSGDRGVGNRQGEIRRGRGPVG